MHSIMLALAMMVSRECFQMFYVVVTIFVFFKFDSLDKTGGDDKQASGGGTLSSSELDVKSIANLLEMLKKSMDSPAENVIINMLSTKIQEFMTNNCFDETNTNIPWHKLLSLPPKQMISVERMHSGARRFVTLDFGSPIMLTDLVIPACEDIVSLCIDIWCFEEDADSVRLANTTDIGTKTLVLSDLQPPPICRYLKVGYILSN